MDPRRGRTGCLWRLLRGGLVVNHLRGLTFLGGPRDRLRLRWRLLAGYRDECYGLSLRIRTRAQLHSYD